MVSHRGLKGSLETFVHGQLLCAFFCRELALSCGFTAEGPSGVAEDPSAWHADSSELVVGCAKGVRDVGHEGGASCLRSVSRFV